MYSMEGKWIFPAIPKVASASMRAALSSVYPDAKGGHHAISGLYAAKWRSRVFAPEEILSFYKFAFVRHPCDRVVSLYMYERAGRRPETFEPIAAFVDRLCGGGYDWMEDLAYVPQVRLLEGHGGEITMDFIGRYESIEDGWAAVSDGLGRQLPPLDVRNRSSGDKPPLTTHDIANIERYYAEDYEAFGYPLTTREIV